MQKNKIKNITLSAMFLAMGVVLPFFTGQVPQIGMMLLPMHIPVFLCGLICGWQYGSLVGFILPLMRSVLFARPNMYPEAISIAFEMAAYALVAGLLYKRKKEKTIVWLYVSIILAMISGRVIRTVVQLSLMGLNGSSVAFDTFVTGTIVTGIPGILLQLIIIPIIMIMLKNRNI